VTATLEQIHLNPALIDLAISRRERLDIVADNQVRATLLPNEVLSSGDARRMMRERFAAQDWEFSNDAPMNRDERNSREW
jgi:hypothetical protein